MRSLVAAATLLLLAVAVLPSAAASTEAASPLGPCQGPADVYCYDDSWTVCYPYVECHTFYHYCLLYYTVSARNFCVDGGILAP